jgi:hypothetical protein
MRFAMRTLLQQAFAEAAIGSHTDYGRLLDQL